MVYNGPSKGCRACRKRRVKCDQAKPACNNCTKRKVECPGYESLFDYRHRNETNSTIMRAQQKEGDWFRRRSTTFTPGVDESQSATPINTTSPQKRDRSARDEAAQLLGLLAKSVDPDPETVVLNWYFANYPMKCTDPQASHGFFILLKPIYLASPLDSPLRPAVAAVACNLMMLFCHQGSDTDIARTFYAKSVVRMNEFIQDPVRSKQDDLLLTTLALNFYDMVNLRWNHDPDNYNNHKNGALALVRHRGAVNHQNDVSRHMTSCIRTALCHWALDSGTSISPDLLQWLTDESVPTNQASKLDMVTLNLVDFRYRFNQLYHPEDVEDGILDQVIVGNMIEEGLQIDGQFLNWIATCPNHWKPLYTAAEDVAPSIREAGLYGDRCAIYWDLSICDLFNTCRIRRLMLLRSVRQLCMASYDPQHTTTLTLVETTMQRLVDEQCETVPYMLGDVSRYVSRPDMHKIQYPSASNGVITYPNPDHDHRQAAAASGGWLASALLASVASLAVKDGELEPFSMRRGQFPWVIGQLNRMKNVFLLSQPEKRSSWRSYRRF